jgi:hypothetical protein
LIRKAVPFLPGAKGLVVPCGKLMTQLRFNALSIFRYLKDLIPGELLYFLHSRFFLP